MRIIHVAVIAGTALLAGCVSDGMGPKTVGGCLVGGAAGGALGSMVGGGSGKLIMTALGTLAGAYAGCSVGESLDRADQLAIQRNSIQTMAYNQPIQWRGQQSGNEYQNQITNYGRNNYGQSCREVTTTGYVGGRPVQIVAQGCQQPDGSWKLIN